MSKILQKDLLSEGFWKNLGTVAKWGVKTSARALDKVAPELTNPIKQAYKGTKEVLGIGDGNPHQYKSDTSSQSQAPYQYRGKYYAPDYSKQAVQKGSDWEIPGYQVDGSNSRISNSQNIITVDQNGIVKNVR